MTRDANPTRTASQPKSAVTAYARIRAPLVIHVPGMPSVCPRTIAPSVVAPTTWSAIHSSTATRNQSRPWNAVAIRSARATRPVSTSVVRIRVPRATRVLEMPSVASPTTVRCAIVHRDGEVTHRTNASDVSIRTPRKPMIPSLILTFPFSQPNARAIPTVPTTRHATTKSVWIRAVTGRFIAAKVPSVSPRTTAPFACARPATRAILC